MSRLALVMIARNEARSIARCLESVKPYVDEMIVLDTGSTDKTISIARKLGATVERFAWSDDFSVARNKALDYSDADWNLILDADEWIEGDTEQLSPRVLGQAPFVGVVPVESKFDLQGVEESSVSWISRILPRGVRYRGRIHEQPVSDLPRKKIPLKVAHDGYRDSNLKSKKGRNIQLLLQALKEDPSNVYFMYQMGKAYQVYEDHADAVRYFGEALKHVRPGDSFRHDLVVRALFSLKKAKAFEQAIELAEQELPNWGHSPDYYFVLGDLLLDWATLNPERARQELLPMIESSWLKCLEIGDRPDLEGSVLGRGSHLAAHNLSMLYGVTGDAEKAESYRKMAEAMRASPARKAKGG